MKFYIRDYGKGAGEEYQAEVSWNTKYVPKVAERAERGESDEAEEIRERTVRRAKRQLIRKSIFNGIDHLLTLTTREDIGDIERMKILRGKFCDEVQREIPGWKYIGAYELHPYSLKVRGVKKWHVHIGVVGRQNVNLLRKIWWGIVGERDGIVQVEEPRKRGGDSRLRAARYIGKYIGKTAGGEWCLNKKNYFHSKNVAEPSVEVIEIPSWGDESVAEMARILLESRGAKMVSVWESLDGQMGRVASFNADGTGKVRLIPHMLGKPHPLWNSPGEVSCCIGPGEG
jgi:hypothetical protein